LTRYIALFRGLNVGGAHKVPMADLRELLSTLGFANVRTYIQSGNALFDTAETAAAATVKINAAFEVKFGFSSPLVLLNAGQLDAAIAASPFAGLTDDHKMLHVGFFAADPDPDRLAILEPLPRDGEQFSVKNQVIYLYLPFYSARSDLAKRVASANLGAPVTVRNWRSVLALAEQAKTID
jgi:uncharacterized protein (DUF1697 family)